MPHLLVSKNGDLRVVRDGSHETILGSFPISIDFADFARAADADEVRRRSTEIRQLHTNITTILGIDRLDYTKGIPERIKAFGLFLRQHPEQRRHTCLVQIVVPSRETIPGYQMLKSEIERLVAQVNGEFAEPGWVPINYIHRGLPKTELLALYRTSDVALVTPLKDGMNLVAKEYCACRLSNDGVLILSEFAGAAPELKSGALLVNPYDQSEVAEALATAVTMELAEQRRRMLRLRTQVRRADLGAWLQAFISVTEGAAGSATIETRSESSRESSSASTHSRKASSDSSSHSSTGPRNESGTESAESGSDSATDSAKSSNESGNQPTSHPTSHPKSHSRTRGARSA
jgi:trehalose 6-phosphate synthase